MPAKYPYQVGDSCLKVNRVVLLSRLSEDIPKTAIFISLLAVFGAGPLALEKTLGQVT